MATAALFPPSADTPAGDRSAAAESNVDGDEPDKPDEALRFRLLQMQDENKRIPADGLLEAKAQVEVMQAAAKPGAGRGAQDGLEVARLVPNDWQWLAQGNIGGRIQRCRGGRECLVPLEQPHPRQRDLRK